MGHRDALDAKIKQVAVVTDKHFSDLHVYLEHLRDRLTTTFLDLLEGKEAVKFWVAAYVRYSHQIKDLTDMEPILLHSGKRIMKILLVLEGQLDTLLDT